MIHGAARYAAFARLQARTVFTYRANYYSGLVLLLVQMLLLQAAWKGFYGDRAVVDGIPLTTMTAYVALATIQSWLFVPWIFSLIPERVRSGKVANDLVIPPGFVGQVVARQFGRTLGLAPLAVIAVPVALLVAGARPPASSVDGLFYVLSLGLGYVVSTLLSVVVGLSAFWTLEIEGLMVVYRMINQFFSGALLPLWFMPDALQVIALLLPFQTVTFTPTAIYLGQLSGWTLAANLGVQAAWVLVLSVLARIIWRRAHRRVVVHGG